MTKTYISAELQIVRMNNSDIVTNSIGMGSNATILNPINAQSPERRRSIWD